MKSLYGREIILKINSYFAKKPKTVFLIILKKRLKMFW